RPAGGRVCLPRAAPAGVQGEVVAPAPNVFSPVFGEAVRRYEESGFRARRSRLGYQAGCERLGLSLWELEPGPMGPFHYHFGNEELLAVLSGRPTVRTPAGSRTLAEGEFVAFPRGPHGAHPVGNDTNGSVRFLIFRALPDPDVIVYNEQ